MYVFLYSSSLTLTARVTAFLNGIETILNLVYLYLAHVVGWPAANLIGFAAATMTLSKTMLYWAQEYYCGYCAVGHNSLPDLLLYFVLPNAFVNSVLFCSSHFRNYAARGLLFLSSSSSGLGRI